MKIVLTGGGSSGHVSPLLAVARELVDSKLSSVPDITFLGSRDGIEKDLIPASGFDFIPVATGKFRRYFDLRNFTDPLKVPVGCWQARRHLKEKKPDIVLSSGGYVSVPVVVAATSLGIPTVLYEADAEPGLANKLLAVRAKHICLGFPDLGKKYPEHKITVTGHPVRPSVLHGNKNKGYAITGFSEVKPVVLVLGGSQGSQFLNDFVHHTVWTLIPFCNVVHICGAGKKNVMLADGESYRQYEYVHEELAHLYAITSLALSRAGASTLAELAAYRIPSILIPLPTAANNHQTANARVFGTRSASIVFEQTQLHEARLLDTLRNTLNDPKQLKEMGESAWSLYNAKATTRIVQVLKELTAKGTQ